MDIHILSGGLMSMCICDLLNYINDLLLPTLITDMMYSYRYLVHPLSNFYRHFRPILLYGHIYCTFLYMANQI